jgi:hypothetical protein
MNTMPWVYTHGVSVRFERDHVNLIPRVLVGHYFGPPSRDAPDKLYTN